MDWFFLILLVVLVGAAIWAFKSRASFTSGDEDNLESVSQENLEEPKANE
jgi:hypothetical protein